MKHQLNKKITPYATAKALREAERQLVKPEGNGGGPVYVEVHPQDIKERLELFQPRRPGWGTRTLDAQHVKRLTKRIRQKGEIEPLLVVKLGGEWIVVDGHHRTAAYRKLIWDEPIKCQWFAGGVREAMDAGMHRNERTHLPIDQGDKHEAAWTRTALDWDGNKWGSSKDDVANLTGCSPRTVGHMRQAVRHHHDYVHHGVASGLGERLSTALGPDLSRYSWNRVNIVRLNVTPEDRDLNWEAASLAKQLDKRMPILRSTDPELTAHALWIYSKDLCPGLVEALQARIEKEERRERNLAAQVELEELERLEKLKMREMLEGPDAPF
jgi:hypothetical protein